MKLQRPGEMEDKKMMGQARSASDARGLMKSFQGRHKDLMKGEDMRDNKAMLERKGKKMMDKVKASSFKSKDKDGKKVYSPKTMAKISSHH